MDYQSNLHKRGKLLLIFVAIQASFSLIGITFAVIEIAYLTGFTSYSFNINDLTSSSRTEVAESYCILSIHALFLVISFFGFPGYKYKRVWIAILHVLSNLSLSLCVVFYFVYMIWKRNAYELAIFLLCPVFGVVVAGAGMGFVKNAWSTPSKDPIVEEFFKGKCANCDCSAMMLTEFSCGHPGVCERCALHIKKCKLCFDQ
jgi:hypothetical protein